jgi:uncharacterized protein (DUF1684 family)
MTILFRFSIFLFLAFAATLAQAQTSDAFKIEEIKHFQDSLNTEFRDPDESPLKPKDFEAFTGLDFFPINLNYYVEAEFIRTPNQPPFQMLTTTSKLKTYEKYAEVHFSLDGKDYSLNVYQSHKLRETEEFKNYLFLPFKDQTNGKESYGGGRYLSLWIPTADSITIDFNKAYNPYCVYNTTYSCPLVPKANWMKAAIPAGVKSFKKTK